MRYVHTRGGNIDEAGGVGEDGATAGNSDGVLKVSHQLLKGLHEVGAVAQLSQVGLVGQRSCV